MPSLPTTRRGRFLYRKKRYTRRRRHQHECWNVTQLINGVWKQTGHYKGPNLGPKQLPGQVKSFPIHPFAQASYPGLTRKLILPGGDGPPTCRLEIGNSGILLSDVRHSGWTFPVAAFQMKRVRGCRPYHDGMTALQRRVWGANYWYHLEGFFPTPTRCTASQTRVRSIQRCIPITGKVSGRTSLRGTCSP